MKRKKFEVLNCWQEAKTLTRDVYSATRNGSFKKDYSLIDQVRRFAISIMANIVEGFSRQGDRKFTQFLFISKASASELQSHLYVSLDQGYITPDCFESSYRQIESIHKRLLNLIKHLKSSSIPNT